MNLFCAVAGKSNVLGADRFRTLIQNLVHSAWICSADVEAAKLFFARALQNQFRCEPPDVVYFLDRSRRPRLFRSARFENQGRTCRSAAVCMLAALSKR
jgi:hypothetical protein